MIWRRPRPWLIFLLAVMTARVGHLHEHDTRDSVPVPRAECRDERLHLSEHRDAPDLSRHEEDCGFCHTSAQPFLTSLGPAEPLLKPVTRHLHAIDRPAARLKSDGHSSRGPPEVG